MLPTYYSCVLHNFSNTKGIPPGVAGLEYTQGSLFMDWQQTAVEICKRVHKSGL